MDVVSTSNLVSSENEKTTANMKLFVEFVEEKRPKKHIYTKQQNQNPTAMS